MNKKTSRILILSFIIILMTVAIFNFNFNAIYDDESKITKNYNSCFSKSTNTKKFDSTISGILELSGMKKIWEYNSDSDEEVELTYNLSTHNGEIKLVLIEANSNLTTILENNNLRESNEIKTITFPVKKGQNRIKLVGRDAKFDYSFEFDKGKL